MLSILKGGYNLSYIFLCATDSASWASRQEAATLEATWNLDNLVTCNLAAGRQRQSGCNENKSEKVTSTSWPAVGARGARSRLELSEPKPRDILVYMYMYI